MSELSPQYIVAWYRQQAKKFNEIADYTEATFKLQTGQTQNKKVTVEDETTDFTTDVTAAQLEAEVREKSGRVKDLAGRLNTNEATIEALLEPASTVYKGGRGWLKTRE